MPPSELVRRLLATKFCDVDRDTYVARHKACVEELAIWVAHIEAGDDSMAGRVEEVLTEMAVSVSGHFLFKPWGPSLLALDAATGKLGEPGMDVWRRVARAQNPSDAYLDFNSIIHRWWKATAATLNAERQALAAEALSAPGDVGLQEEVTAALGSVNLSYLLSATASGVLLSTTFLTALQGAKMWIHIWPRFPLLTAMVLAYDELAAERAEARLKALHRDSGAGGGDGDLTGGSGGDTTVFEAG